MANKFNINSIKGETKIREKKEESETATEKLRVGAGFFQDFGKKHIGMDVTFVPRKEIDKNPRNFYSIGQIDTLAQSIRFSGLSQPLEVKKQENGRYLLIGGERRLTAIDSLIENPDITDWTEDAVIACIVKDPEDINLDLSPEKKEDFAIITTNKEARKYTDGDAYMEIQKWKGIIQELRENGVEYITGSDEEDADVVQIKGKKTRDILAKTTGLSTGQISKYEKIDLHGTDAIKDALLNNNISVSVAEKAVSELSPEEQDALAQDSGKKKVKSEDVKTYMTDKKEKKTLTLNQFESDIKSIMDELQNKEIRLDENEEEKYYFHIRQLKKIIQR